MFLLENYITEQSLQKIHSLHSIELCDVSSTFIKVSHCLLLLILLPSTTIT